MKQYLSVFCYWVPWWLLFWCQRDSGCRGVWCFSGFSRQCLRVFFLQWYFLFGSFYYGFFLSCRCALGILTECKVMSLLPLFCFDFSNFIEEVIGVVLNFWEWIEGWEVTGCQVVAWVGVEGGTVITLNGEGCGGRVADRIGWWCDWCKLICRGQLWWGDGGCRHGRFGMKVGHSGLV